MMALHGGQFGADVVDAQGAKRRKQVLDRFHRGLTRAETGLELLASAQV
jgi:hypothetical protein